MTRKLLSEILHGSDEDRIRDAWARTEAAEDYGTPLPSGEYTCHVVGCDPFNARQKGTPGVRLAFKVIEGEHAGRRAWHDCWLTEAALPQTKRDLAKLAVTTLDQLERPLPQGIRCVVKLALRKDDDGTERNRVRSFQVVGLDEPEVDAFAPAENPPQPGSGDAAEPPPNVPVNTSFDPATLSAESVGGAA
jgi:hypothetical protein